MINAQKDMLRDTIPTQTANCTSPVATGLPIHMAARTMIDPAKFYSGMQDLDSFLSQLKNHFNIQSH